MNYNIKLESLTKEGSKTINDLRLSFYLMHQNSEETILMETEQDGQKYALVLAGNSQITDHKEDVSYYSKDGINTLPDLSILDKAASDEDKRYTLEDGSFFEWIDIHGDRVGDIKGEIFIDPSMEINQLKIELISHLDQGSRLG